MNRRMPAVLSLLLLVGIVLILPGRVTGDAQFQEPTAVIDPALLETLQTQTEADVLISLKPPGIPFEEQTTEVSRTEHSGAAGPGALRPHRVRLHFDPPV